MAGGAVFQFENARQLQIARCVASQKAAVNEGDGCQLRVGGQSAATYDNLSRVTSCTPYIVGVD